MNFTKSPKVHLIEAIGYCTNIISQEVGKHHCYDASCVVSNDALHHGLVMIDDNANWIGAFLVPHKDDDARILPVFNQAIPEYAKLVGFFYGGRFQEPKTGSIADFPQFVNAARRVKRKAACQ